MNFKDCPHNGGLRRLNKKLIICSLCGYTVFLIDDDGIYKAVKVGEKPVKITVKEDPRLAAFIHV